MDEDHPKTIHDPIEAKALDGVFEGVMVDPWGHHHKSHQIGDNNSHQPVIVRLNGR